MFPDGGQDGLEACAARDAAATEGVDVKEGFSGVVLCVVGLLLCLLGLRGACGVGRHGGVGETQWMRARPFYRAFFGVLERHTF